MVCCGNPDAKCCGHPSGVYIWLPLLFIITAMVLSGYGAGSCSLAHLSNGQSVTLGGFVCTGTSSTNSSVLLGCIQENFVADTFGIFTFQNASNGECIPYYSQSVVANDGFWKSAIAFYVLFWLCGIVLFFWLLLTTCCPIRPEHKSSLIILSTLAFVFSAFTFLFYGNSVCKEYGCQLASGGNFAISSTVIFFATIFTLFPIKAEHHAVLQQPGREPEQQQREQFISQKATIDSAEEGLQPAVTGLAMDGQP